MELPLDAKLEAAGAWSKRKYVVASLLSMSPSFDGPEFVSFGRLLAAQKDGSKVKFHAFLADLLNQLSKQNFLSIDKWIFDLTNHSTLRLLISQNLKRIAYLIAQAVMVALFSSWG